jgi:HK97 family phage portal protein
MGRIQNALSRAFLTPETRNGKMLSGVVPPRPGGSVRSVNETQAFALSAVSRAVQILSTGMMQLPLDTYNSTGKKFANPSLVKQPDTWTPTPFWVEQYVNSLLIRGEAFLLKTRRADGTVSNLQILNPNNVSITKDDGNGNALEFKIGDKPYTTEEITHSKLVRVPGVLHGRGPLQNNQEALRGALDVASYAHNWFVTGGIPTGFLKTGLSPSPEDAQHIKDSFKKRGSGDVVILPNGMEYEKVDLSPAEVQWIESQEYYDALIARMFGVEPSLMNVKVNAGGLNYTNTESAEIRFIRWGLLMRIGIEIEQQLTANLPRGQYVRFNWNALLKADTKTGAAWKLVNEVRKLEDEPELDEKGLEQLAKQNATNHKVTDNNNDQPAKS